MLLAAKIVVAVGLGLIALWAPLSLWIAVVARDTKNWLDALVGGSLAIAGCTLPLAGLLFFLGKVF